jgi:hypothetical protein
MWNQPPLHRAIQGLPLDNQILALAIGFGILFKFFFIFPPSFDIDDHLPIPIMM